MSDFLIALEKLTIQVFQGLLSLRCLNEDESTSLIYELIAKPYLQLEPIIL